MYCISRTTADNLQEYDRFKLGGTMCEIEKVQKSFREITVHFHLVTDRSIINGKFTVPENVIFKIYNQGG